ncbi:MAG: hypothetical protein WD874_01335 [Parcubacteria group bacterium]
MRVLKTRRNSPILSLISLGDVKMRDLTHDAAHWYSYGKEKGAFIIKKQVPLHSRNLLNKSVQTTREKGLALVTEIKQSVFKKNDGLSEFFKSISDKEIVELEKKDFQKAEEEVKPRR